MDLKVIAKLAVVAGMICAVFAILSAAVAYGLLSSTTSSWIHLSTIRLTVWSAMLPYLFFSVVSFSIAIFISRFAGVLKPQQISVTCDTQVESEPSEAPL
jgi:TRAP-type C4-dicarboxylate transport system permease small subunit